MNQPYYTRYVKLVSTDEIDPSHIVPISSEQKKLRHVEDPTQPATEEFYKIFFSVLLIEDYILYPVRISNVYVLSNKKKSTIYSSKTSLLKDLQKKGLLSKDESVEKIFRSSLPLNFDQIAQVIKSPNVKVLNFPKFEYIFTEEDIFSNFISSNDQTSVMYVIPCLYENKYLIEFFLRTISPTDYVLELEKQLISDGFSKAAECFEINSDVLDEISKTLDFPF